MKTKQITVTDAYHIDVVCKDNDWDDIKCGGPATLGYDFFVSSDIDIIEIETKIKNLLKQYNRSFKSIYHSIVKDLNINNLWDLSKIEKCIKEENVC